MYRVFRYNNLTKTSLNSSKFIRHSIVPIRTFYDSRKELSVFPALHQGFLQQRCRSTVSGNNSQQSNLESSDEEIKLTNLSEEILSISFNRPQKANAMGRTMLSQIQDVISALNGDDAGSKVRCIILTSCSEKVFSAGADLQERSKMTMDEAAYFVTALRTALDGLATLPMPIIACVEGAALGGGLEIALTADIIIAGSNATFGLTETSLAIIPGAGGTVRLPRLIGAARAKEMIYTAQKIDASTAYEYGIVQHLVEAGGTEIKATEIAQAIARNGPLAVRAAKRSIQSGMDLKISEGMEIERKNYQTIIPTSDRLEGLAAFREKRAPTFKGK